MIISEKQVQEILKEIKKYQKERRRTNKFIESILWQPENIQVTLGDNILDSLLNVLEIVFNDNIDLFNWYVFESEFGEKTIVKEINDIEVKINSVTELLAILTHRRKEFNLS